MRHALVAMAVVAVVLAPTAASAAPPPDACPSGTHASHTHIVFKEFRTVAGGDTTPVYLDEYDPVDPTSPAPAVVLIHGGGWTMGCRRLDDTEAVNLRAAGYVVFSIDYRLACKGNETGWQPEVLAMCGWQFDTVDPDTMKPSAATQDIQDAMAWVRLHAGEYATWNGRVAAIGSSAGGHLLLESIALAADPDQRPDVAATWSGAIETGRFVTPPDDGWASADTCDHSGSVSQCWLALSTYLHAPGCGRPLDQNTTDPCADGTTWTDGSPYIQWSQRSRADLVPVFFSNGGGPDGDVYRRAETVPLREAGEFAALLPGLGFASDEFEGCVVNTSRHGLRYLYDHHCDGHPTTESVFASTVAFLERWAG